MPPSSFPATIRLGTTNPNKLQEIRELLAPLGVRVDGCDDLDFRVEEDGATFAENAIKKAQALLELTNRPALADDSGLVVDALEGRPGIYSARYAGVEGPGADAANRKKLLMEMKGVPQADRTARFVCALAYCAPGEAPKVFEGTMEGAIGAQERGSHGFGYDSLFVVRGDTRTSAELEPEEKNAISHRARAIHAFVEWLSEGR